MPEIVFRPNAFFRHPFLDPRLVHDLSCQQAARRLNVPSPGLPDCGDDTGIPQDFRKSGNPCIGGPALPGEREGIERI